MTQQQKKGFTLIELLVVIAIIGILSAIGISSLGNARTKARDAKRRADLASVRTALAIYYDDNSVYPNTDGVVTAAAPTPTGGLLTLTTAGSIGTIPTPPAKGQATTLGDQYKYKGGLGSSVGVHWMLVTQLEKTGVPYYYVNDIGGQTETAFASGEPACTNNAFCP